MDRLTYIYAIMCLVGWGVSALLAKVAASRIGEKAVFWDMLGYVPAIIIYCLVAFRIRDLATTDRTGILIAIASGVIGAVGAVGFYLAVTRRDASIAVPLTALYPALTAILAFIFLKESLTLTKGIGIVLASAALILLGM